MVAPRPTDHLLDLDGTDRLTRPELEARAKALRTVNAITSAVLAATSPNDVFTRTVDAIAHFTRFPGIALFEWNEPSQSLHLLHSRGFAEATVHAALQLPLHGSLTGAAVQRRELVSSADVGRDVRTEPAVREQLAREGFSAIVSVPLVIGERVLGAMNLIYRGELGLSPHEREMLQSIGQAVAIAMDHAQHVQRLRRERQRSQESEARYRITLHSIADAVIGSDRAGHVTLMNRHAEQLTGYHETEAIGRPLQDVLRLRDGGAVLVDRDGTEHYVDQSTAPVLDEHGERSGSVFVCRDVTDTRREEKWRAFMHDARGLLGASIDFDATLANVATLAVSWHADWCLVDLAQLDGSILRPAGVHLDRAKQPLVDAVVKATRLDPDAPDGVPRVLRTGLPLLESDIAPEDLAAGERMVFGTAKPEYADLLRALDMRSCLVVPLVCRARATGSLLLAVGRPNAFSRRDVERAQDLAHCFANAIDNARLYRQARDAVAVRDEFLSVAAHELRTPLTALQLDLESLERTCASRGEESFVAKIRRARQQAKRLARLSEGLVDVSRLSTGNVSLRSEPVDLRELVAGVVEHFREEAARAGCVIQLDPGPAVVGSWDRTRIEQVVSNLLSNAVKYGAGYPVELSVRTAEGMARITVADHGIGISPQDATRIFERFERAAPSRHYGGLGLGLYVAREIVQAHGGSILVSSQPGAGATFTVVLPMHTARTAAQPPPQSAPASATPASPSTMVK